MNHELFFYLNSLLYTNPLFDWFVLFVAKYLGWIISFIALSYACIKIVKVVFYKKNGEPSLYDMSIKEYGIHVGAGIATIVLRVFGVSRPETISNKSGSLESTLDYSRAYFEERRKEYQKRKYALATIAFSSISAWTISLILKLIIGSSRPFVIFPDVRTLIEYGWNDSFPSGHAMFFSALATSLLFSYKKIGFLYMFFALLIGLARVIAGIHFPVDVIFGWIFGTVVAISVRYLLLHFKIFKRKEIDIYPEKK